MTAPDSLKRLGGGRWETRDGRFTIEPQWGTWVIVDNEQIDELGLALIRGPFRSLTAAKDAIETARTEGPKASPLAGRLERVRDSEQAARKAPSRKEASPEPEAAKPEPPAEPKWLRALERRDQRRARDLIARLQKMGVDDPERVVRAEIVDGQPALARLALERALAKALESTRDGPGAARATVSTMLRGADLELGVSWRLVDDEGRRIEEAAVPE